MSTQRALGGHADVANDVCNSVPCDYWKHFGTLRRMVIWRHVEASTEILVHSGTL
jgi:hypothetical protein